MILYKKIATYTLFFVALVLLGTAPHQASAQTVSSRVTVVSSIDSLKAEVVRLQKQLAILLAAQAATRPEALPSGPYELRFFDRSFDSIYRVDGDGLVRIGGRSTGVHSDEKKLFQLLVAVAGKSALTNYVHEWRVFNDKGTDLGAFVESIANTDKWVVGVNRANFDDGDDESVEAFVELLTHEFAHILLDENPEFRTEFKADFWTKADVAHANRIKSIDFDDRTEELEEYYIDNERRFVSDYATSNVDEDLAETFVEFVFNETPSDRLVRNQKVLSFYQESWALTARQGILARLKELGVY